MTARRALRVGALILALAAFTMFPAAFADAHPDRPAASGEHQIAPGAAIDFPIEVHFHRLVGDFAVLGAGSVSLLVIEEDAFTRYGSSAQEGARRLAEGGSTGRVNALFACCIGAKWTAYRLVVRNQDATRSVSVRLRMVLIHDGFAVFVYDAEGGAAAGAVGVTAGLSAATAWPLWPRFRAGPSRSPTKRRGRLLGAATALFASTTLLAVTLGVIGALAFGGSLAEGFVASPAFWHVLSGGAGDLVVFLLWAASLLLWGRSAAASSGTALGAAVFGFMAGGVALGLGALIAATYGTVFVPALTSAIASAPLIGGGLALLRSGTRSVAR